MSRQSIAWYGLPTPVPPIRIIAKALSPGLVQPTWNTGNECNYLGTPFIDNCKYDAAFDILNHTVDTTSDSRESHKGGQPVPPLFFFLGSSVAT